jgi:hypothetical protein
MLRTVPCAGVDTSDPTCMSQMKHDSTNTRISSTAACKRPYQTDSFAIQTALALKTYVGSANGRFAIAVYYASDENWDDHARLSRTSRWNANIQADHSA